MPELGKRKGKADAKHSPPRDNTSHKDGKQMLRGR
jgi:hypothetical protein